MKDIVNLINLTVEQHKRLLVIYQNCKTYKIRYKYPGMFQNELCWPESLEEYNYIKNTMLVHFNLENSDIAHIPYNEENKTNMENYIDLPYKPSAINFVHFYPGDYVNSHSNKTFSVMLEAKINVPVLNTQAATLKFEKSHHTSRYPSPILLNEAREHKALGMGKNLQKDRVFLQISLNKKFLYYYKKLKWNSFQENDKKSGDTERRK